MLSPRLAKSNYRIDTIIEGWFAAREKAPPDSRLADGKLVILRAGADDASWSKILAKIEAGDSRSVHTIEEHLTPNQMAMLYNAASATVMIPETDLLAMSLLEALACGSLPIVADLPCYRSAMSNLSQRDATKPGGIFTSEPNSEGIATALAEWSALGDGELKNIGEVNSRIVHSEHDWEKCAPKMVAIYRELTGQA